MEVLATLQDLPSIAALRASRWTYPAVNAAHVLGLALLFGAIVPMDLRLLGVGRRIDERALSRLLLPVAVTGLVLALASGALLFAVRATEYGLMPVVQAKLALVALALVNASLAAATSSPAVRRAAAAASLLLWTAVILCGRMIGYWGA